MMKPMTTTPTPLVTREALLAFTQRLVECYAPEKVILFGSLARGDARWDSDADILVVMPFEGRHLAKIREMRRLCPVIVPLDLLVRRPEEFEACWAE
jgi:predicted nucleotidyltransferase